MVTPASRNPSATETGMWNPSGASARRESQNARLLQHTHEHVGGQQQEQVVGAVTAATAQRWRTGGGSAEARWKPSGGLVEALQQLGGGLSDRWQSGRGLVEALRRLGGVSAEAWRRSGGGLGETLHRLGRGLAEAYQRLVVAVGVLVAAQVACNKGWD